MRQQTDMRVPDTANSGASRSRTAKTVPRPQRPLGAVVVKFQDCRFKRLRKDRVLLAEKAGLKRISVGGERFKTEEDRAVD